MGAEMNVAELIELLKDCDPDEEVMVAYKSGDYWKTVLAGNIKGLESGRVTESAYHGGHKVLDDDDERADTDDAVISRVVLIQIDSW
jgi:hypothetical protein